MSITAWAETGANAYPGHIACSGAKLDDIDKKAQGSQGAGETQLSSLKKLSPAPDMVTVTIGGNDVGFAGVLASCYADPTDITCRSDIDKAKTAISNLATRLKEVYRKIQEIPGRPRLVVVGYPQIVNSSVKAYANCVTWALPGTLGKLQELAAPLNNQIKASALSVGAEYVDVTNVLAGHELCTDVGWVRSISVASGNFNSIAGHPLQEGQEAIKAQVARYLSVNPFPPPPVVKPAAPVLQVTGKTASSVSLSWTAPAGATGYRVYQDGALKQSPTSTTATMTGLASNKAYTFQVKAFNSAGESGFSNAKTETTSQVAPAAPTLSVTGKTANSVSLSWTAPAGATGYRVYQDGALKQSPTSTTATMTGLSSNKAYSFQVKAFNTAGESGFSNTKTETTLPTYLYSFVSQSSTGDPAHARPGQEFTVTLKVKNTGTATWTPSGASPVFLGTTRPNNRTSEMAASGWVTATRPARLQEGSVAPGGTGTFVFAVKTPAKAGKLTEYFTLVAENTSWFNDAGVSVTIVTTPIVGTAARPGTNGQWNVASDGGVFAENGAPFHGSKGGQALNAPIVGIAATRSGNGYWLVGADGGVFAYGDATFAGSMAGKPLNRPVVGMTGTPSGQGYWLVGGDGGVYAYGDAGFHGSMGDKPLNAAVVGITSTPSGQGYWLVGADGGVFAYGDAQFNGSMADKPLNKPIVGIAPDGTASGYFLVGGDGGIYAYGSARFLGSAGSSGTARPTVGMTVRDAGYLTVDSAGASLFYDGTISTPPAPPPPPPPPSESDGLFGGQTLGEGARLVSGNGEYVLVMQGDGNLVEYAPGGRPVWASGTDVPGTVLINQSDGNMVLVAPGGRPVWATGTNGNPDAVLVVQNDANVVVIAPGNRPVWASGTRP